MERSPITKSIKFLSSCPQRSTSIFYGALFLVFCVLIGVGLCPDIQKTMMRKFHFMPRPFVQWAMLQFVPSMYNFKNDFFESLQPLPIDARMEDRPEVQHFTVNHYPLRMVYFYYSRQTFVFPKPVYVYIRTTFRKQEITTSYMMVSSSKGIQIYFLNAYEYSDNK